MTKETLLKHAPTRPRRWKEGALQQ